MELPCLEPSIKKWKNIPRKYDGVTMLVTFFALTFSMLASADTDNCGPLISANRILVPAKVCKPAMQLQAELNKSIPALIRACHKMDKALNKKVKLSTKQIESFYQDSLNFITPPQITPLLKDPPSPECELDFARYSGFREKSMIELDVLHQKLLSQAAAPKKDKNKK